MQVQIADSQKLGLSIVEFCRQVDISRSLFYVLEKEGKAPRSVKIGRRRIIPVESAQRWLQEMADAISA